MTPPRKEKKKKKKQKNDMAPLNVLLKLDSPHPREKIEERISETRSGPGVGT